MQKVSIVVPNWNGEKSLADCLESLRNQTPTPHIILVDNGSTDSSLQLTTDYSPEVEIILLGNNQGFAGGVNFGIKRSLELGVDYIALFNNDAVADKRWLENLTQAMQNSPRSGIVTSKMLSGNGKTIDSTGDFYTIWGLPHPRGRGEKTTPKYDKDSDVFGGSGGASLYRTKMLRQIGLFDEDFFAYYEDVDLSFRAQLAGWKVAYEPKAVVYHQIGGTSGKIKDFTTYQTMKNLPWLLWKNVPRGLLLKILPRFMLAYWGIYLSAIRRGQVLPATKGGLVSFILLPKKLLQRHNIQKNRMVSDDYIKSIIIYDLPPNAHKLRNLRYKWWKLIRSNT